jgi:flavin-dependent dehydrogenase
MNPDLFIAGGGPAGLATAIVAARSGLSVIVSDTGHPPIDKACGEGLLPDALEALSHLGIDLSFARSFPLHGIRFLGTGSTPQASFPHGVGRGIQRTVLHSLLLRHAEAAGVRFLWNTTFRGIQANSVLLDSHSIHPRWIIGADGYNSQVRRSAGLDRKSIRSQRIGLRQHFHVAPWSHFVEVYWGEHSQAYVTPVADDEICVAIVSRHRLPGFLIALSSFPGLVHRLKDASPSKPPRGHLTQDFSLRRVTTGNVALVGDASGAVDAITGEGLALAFRQAVALSRALRANDLGLYQVAHRDIAHLPHLMSRALLFMDAFPHLQHRVLAAFQRQPSLFHSMLTLHLKGSPPRLFGRSGLLNLGSKLLLA